MIDTNNYKYISLETHCKKIINYNPNNLIKNAFIKCYSCFTVYLINYKERYNAS